MAKSKTKRELTFLVHQDDVKTAAGKERVAGEIADGVVALIQAERKHQGLPPLK